MSGKPAAYLDRDGTIIIDREFLRDPDQVTLLPRAATAIRRLNEAGMPVIVVTNQSGIARGLMTEQDYERVRMRLDQLLAGEGARIDASYHCPHHPDITGPCDCRKPGVALFQRATAEHGLDPTRSFYVGDRGRDVKASEVLGGTGIVVRSPFTDGVEGTTYPIVDSLADAVDMILGPA